VKTKISHSTSREKISVREYRVTDVLSGRLNGGWAMRTYNDFPMRTILRSLTIFALTGIALAQQPSQQKPNANPEVLPKASLWNHYSFQFQPSGALGPYHWRILGGSLPRDLSLQENGILSGNVNEQRSSDFLAVEIDRRGKQQTQKHTLAVESPLTASWSRRTLVNGNRVEGSIRVSNTTGRDFDLTYIVLAVNEIGRATAIGYQHFSLKQNTRDQELPFGETLPRGDYIMNVDVIGEEPQSNMIFRSRLVSGTETVAQGP
jgi:hypothetical protein